jgi:uncharacterized protein YggE
MAQERYIEVTGVGTATTTPDRLRARLAAESGAPTVAQAFNDASNALQAMLAILREQGVGDDDLRSTDIGIHSNRDRGQSGQGFHASMGVEARLSDIDSAGAALSAAVEAGGDASRVYGISLESSTTAEAMSEAREAAWANARAKAEQYAALAGRSLGGVLSVSEPRRRGGGGGIPLAVAASASGEVSVEAGTRTLHAAIRVRWELSSP